ncbi:MAG: hypothetical protein ACC707_07090 [Thiohalomonadales bacterium]
MDNLIRLLSKVPDRTKGLEALYVDPLLIDAIFNDLFGGTSKILQLIEDCSEEELKDAEDAGIKNSMVSWLIALKTDLSTQNKDTEAAKLFIENDLALSRKIKICEAALEDNKLILDDPSPQKDLTNAYLRFKNTLSTFTILEEARLTQALGAEATKLVLQKWQRVQSLTPNHAQLALASGTPFLMTAIIEIQDGLNGSIYISSPPEDGSSRSVLAKIAYQENGIYFLKIYWVLDKTP